ncbi:hypothetical protein KSS87_016480 [Heliosperma pusillum]|nr:hypothetical protein KSS87_016480 [Heliosperma pusillum]
MVLGLGYDIRVRVRILVSDTRSHKIKDTGIRINNGYDNFWTRSMYPIFKFGHGQPISNCRYIHSFYEKIIISLFI